MAVHQERWAGTIPEASDHVVPAVVGSLGNTGERIIPDPLGDREAVDLEAEPLQFVLDDLLGRLLAAHRAGCGDQALQERERRLGAFGDREVEEIEVQTELPKWSNV